MDLGDLGDIKMVDEHDFCGSHRDIFFRPSKGDSDLESYVKQERRSARRRYQKMMVDLGLIDIGEAGW